MHKSKAGLLQVGSGWSLGPFRPGKWNACLPGPAISQPKGWRI